MMSSHNVVLAFLACIALGAPSGIGAYQACRACEPEPTRLAAIQLLHREGAVVIFHDGSRYSPQMPEASVLKHSVESIRYFAENRSLRWSRSFPSPNPSLPGPPKEELLRLSEAELDAILLLKEVELLGLAATDINDEGAARLAELKNLSILELGPEVSVRQGTELKKALSNAAVDY